MRSTAAKKTVDQTDLLIGMILIISPALYLKSSSVEFILSLSKDRMPTLAVGIETFIVSTLLHSVILFDILYRHKSFSSD